MKIYKKDTKGKLRFLEITTVGPNLLQSSGVLGTNNPVLHTKECKGKNIGKSNETFPSQQAILEAKAIIKDKLTEGYFETMGQADSEIVILPMLAKSYDDEKHKIDWTTSFIQRKYDGMRCLAHCTKEGYVKLISRDGKIIENVEHIVDELSRNFKEDIVLDGELWCEGSFQDNMKLIKKYRRGETEKINYNIYDIVNTEYNFIVRWDILDKYFFNIDENSSIKLVETLKIANEEQLIDYHKQFISEGFEGSIIRHSLNGYQTNKRSSDLLKYKDFQDIDAEIIDILPNEANPLHGTPLLRYFVQKLSGKIESVFKAGVKMSHEDRADLLLNKDKYIGKIANIRFFEYTDDGIPRFPVMIGIHEDRS